MGTSPTPIALCFLTGRIPTRARRQFRLLLKFIKMKKTKNQNIDGLIQGIKLITEDRCSLLDKDVDLLNEVIVLLETLKQKRKRKDDIEIVLKVVELLSQFMLLSSHVSHIINIQKV